MLLRGLVLCEVGLVFISLQVAELQAQALRVVGKSYRQAADSSRSSLRDVSRPAVEEAEIVLVAVETPGVSEGPEEPTSVYNPVPRAPHPAAPSSRESSVSKLSKLRPGIETVVQNQTEPGFVVQVVHVDQHDLHLPQTSKELVQLFFPSSKTRFSSRFAQCRCNPDLLTSRGIDQEALLQLHISVTEQTSRSTEQIVMRLVKRILKMACPKEEGYGDDELYLEKTTVDTGIRAEALRLITEEDKHPLTLKVLGKKAGDFKARDKNEKGDKPGMLQPAGRSYKSSVHALKSSLHKSGMPVAGKA